MTDSPVAAVRALLPWWAPWGNLLLCVPVGAVASTLAAWVAWVIATGPLRKALRAGALDPQERARLEHPYHRSVVPVRIGSGLLFGTTSLLFVNELSRVPAALLFVVVAAASWWAPSLVLRRRRDPAKPRATWKQRARVVALLLFLYLRLPLTVAMCAAIGFELDATAWIAIAVGGLAFVVHWTLGIGFLLRALRIVRPASERLRAAVALAAERCKTRVPAAFELDAPLAAAFALPASRCVVVTTRTLEFLDERELASICTHEVAHLTEGRLAGVGRNAIDLLLLSIAFFRPIVLGIGLLPAAGLVLAAYVVALVVGRFTVARGEARADAIAHAAESDGVVYLAALEKLHHEAGHPLAMTKHVHGRRGFLRMVFGRGGVHGSFAERAAALGAEPPRDARPPSRWRGLVARLAGVGVLAATTATLLVVNFSNFGWPLHGDVGDPVTYLAFGGDLSAGLVSYAPELVRQGRRDDAVRALQIARGLPRSDPFRLFVIAERLAELDQLDDARSALEAARATFPRSAESDAEFDELEPGWSARITALETRLGAAGR
ncbi:MAG TPA: M48 family metalloprotease [Planctomycetota bacterium]|nr:M48 family metalloprotease [Planctomycetota bacterium]